MNFKRLKSFIVLSASVLIFSSGSYAKGEEIGSITTAFKLLGANHRIAIEVFDDPKVQVLAIY